MQFQNCQISKSHLMPNPMLRVQFITFSGRRYITTLTLPENFNVGRSYTDQIKFGLLGVLAKKTMTVQNVPDH